MPTIIGSVRAQGCDMCGGTHEELYHFDALMATNPWNELALCDACNTVAVAVDEAIHEATRHARDAATEHAKPLEALAAAERLILWNERQADVCMTYAGEYRSRAECAEGDEAEHHRERAGESILAAGAHHRAAADLRFVRAKLLSA